MKRTLSFRRPVLLAGILCLWGCLSIKAESKQLPLPNPGFEEGTAGWFFDGDGGMSSVSPEAAASGKFGLRVVDESTEAGSSALSPKIRVTPGTGLRLSFKARLVSGSGIGVYIRFYDLRGRRLSEKDDANIPPSTKGWKVHTLETLVPEKAATVELWVHSYDRTRVVVDFDDFLLETFTPEVKPPWEPAYKLDPDETARLTEADVPGPDGIVYPDWSKAGVPGGIPQLPVVVGSEFFQGLEGKNISPRLKEAFAKASEKGGGTVLLPPGEFQLEESIVIRDHGVVLRGAGKDRTTLVFRDQVPYGSIRLFNWADTENVMGPGGCVEFQANPRDLAGILVESGGKTLKEITRAAYVQAWGNRFALRFTGEELLSALDPGVHEIKVTATYGNGETFSETFPISLVQNDTNPVGPDQNGIVVFLGPGRTGPEISLVEDGNRGSRSLRLTSGHGFKPGDRLQIEAPITERWNQIVGNRSPSSRFRVGQFEVESVNGDNLILTQPLRIDFPVADGSFVQKIETVDRSGIEDLTLRQEALPRDPSAEKIPGVNWYPTDDLWVSGITASYGWGCWANNVKVENACRNPIYLTRSKFCEIRDCDVDGALFKGGGGTGYVGFERSFDCLMDGVTTRGMRHAPDLQWGAAGNVIRNGSFIGSDGQWHAGWTNENLFEGNVIFSTEADRANGCYGFGLFASGPDSPLHGPQGPRNVVYNNDITSPKDGLHMRGGNEGWIIAHNRFRIGNGRAVYGKQKSFDHTILGNVFIIEKPVEPVVFFEAPNCTGIELVDNTFEGPIQKVVGFRSGVGSLAREEGNRIEPAGSDTPRPAPAVASIFEWQRSQLKAPEAPLPSDPPSSPSPSPGWWDRILNFFSPKKSNP